MVLTKTRLLKHDFPVHGVLPLLLYEMDKKEKTGMDKSRLESPRPCLPALE